MCLYSFGSGISTREPLNAWHDQSNSTTHCNDHLKPQPLWVLGSFSVSSVLIEQIVAGPPPDLTVLRREGMAEGHHFIERTLTEWDDGSNRFDMNGEGFFIARSNQTVVGMCGLNIDPFLTDPTIGRIRHLYVLPSFRRRGIGKKLMEACLHLAQSSCDRVRLRTFDGQPADFYVSIGFNTVEEDTATHSLQIGHWPHHADHGCRSGWPPLGASIY